MNTQRSLGWTSTMVHFAVATPAQRSADFRESQMNLSTSDSAAHQTRRGSLPQPIPARSKRVVTGRR